MATRVRNMKNLIHVANSCRHNKNLDRLISAMREGTRFNQNNGFGTWAFSPLELEVAKDWGILLRQEFNMTYECYIPAAWHVRFAKEVAYSYGIENTIETPDWVPQKSLARILESLGIEWYTEDDVHDDVPLKELINYGYYIKHDGNYWLLVTNLYELSKNNSKMSIVNKFLSGLGR